MTEPSGAVAPEPKHGFEDSRRLTGPSRFFAGTAVTLTPLSCIANDEVAHARWRELVTQMAQQLGWPAPQCVVQRHQHGTLLMCSAPVDALMTATEISEWAWERCMAEAGVTGFDLAQDHGAAAAAVFAARAGAEARPQQAALRAVAAARGLPIFEDDDELSIGAGCGSRCWPLAALLDVADVPWAALHDVPTALITGSNGKTTVARLLAAIARAAGLVSGLCSTEGVVIDGQVLTQGDYAGPAGARTVLRDVRVQAAVLETARGGILRRGLAVWRADVAVVTNISADHFGEYGVDSASDIADVKLTLARALHQGGTLVLNGEDELLMAAAQRLPHAATAAAAKQALFALDAEHPRLQAWRRAGGRTCGVSAENLQLFDGSTQHVLGVVAAMPMTLHAAARHNIANAAAAALAAHAMGMPIAAIRAALASFGAQPSDNPGRLERWPWRGATVLVDYAHNPEGLAQLLRVANALAPRRLGLLLGQAGNRADDAIVELARVAALAPPDRVVIKELPGMLRGRALGELPALLQSSLVQAGLNASCIEIVPDEEAAAMLLLQWAQPGDVIVLPVHTTAVRERLGSLLSQA